MHRSHASPLRPLVAILLWTVAAAGCTDACSMNPSIDASSFERSCDESSDCTVVAEGSICERCRTERSWTAIRRDALETYRKTWDRFASGCPSSTGCELRPPPNYRAVCSEGVCRATASADSSSQRRDAGDARMDLEGGR